MPSHTILSYHPSQSRAGLREKLLPFRFHVLYPYYTMDREMAPTENKPKHIQPISSSPFNQHQAAMELKYFFLPFTSNTSNIYTAAKRTMSFDSWLFCFISKAFRQHESAGMKQLRAQNHYWLIVLFANKDKVLLGFFVLLSFTFVKKTIDFKDNN